MPFLWSHEQPVQASPLSLKGFCKSHFCFLQALILHLDLSSQYILLPYSSNLQQWHLPLQQNSPIRSQKWRSQNSLRNMLVELKIRLLSRPSVMDRVIWYIQVWIQRILLGEKVRDLCHLKPQLLHVIVYVTLPQLFYAKIYLRLSFDGRPRGYSLIIIPQVSSNIVISSSILYKTSPTTGGFQNSVGFPSFCLIYF